MSVDLAPLEAHWNCRLTTRGRKSGQPRTVTIWFALEPGEGDAKIFLTGDAKPPQWVRNLRANPEVTVQIGKTRLRGRARVAGEAEAETIRRRFTRRYFLARVARAIGRGYVDSVAVVVEHLEPA
jgi:deazaflavin-dependent oxidoreductase (nitroreductase family)